MPSRLPPPPLEGAEDAAVIHIADHRLRVANAVLWCCRSLLDDAGRAHLTKSRAALAQAIGAVEADIGRIRAAAARTQR